MAERRMFAKTIIDSDAFLDMPHSAQLLYFHLSMRADDEGFINNPKAIMRNVGCKDDDVKILILKKFVIPFESGVVVIKHWRIHNYIQKDRFNETKYKEEKEMLSLDENKAYVANSAPCIQNVSNVDTQYRLGKDSIDNIYAQNDQAFEQFWSEYPKKKAKQNARKAFAKAIKSVSLETLLESVKRQKETEDWITENGKYIPYPATWLNGGCWEDDLEEQKPAGRWVEDEVDEYGECVRGHYEG